MSEADWRPKGVDFLEPAALQALIHNGNACVIAGPGAGKTEFLAQKACYLLETKKCKSPFKILAISFKKDSASNLKERIDKRCCKEEAERFESYTFDAFSKNIVDRFRMALPEQLRPTINYEIMNFQNYNYQNFLNSHRDNAGDTATQSQIASIQTIKFQNQILATHDLSLKEPDGLNNKLAYHWFKQCLESNSIDFQLINRLAKYLIKNNREIHNAILATYQFIFLDEFQDTTYSQYDLLGVLLKSFTNQITAVGDGKQKIMGWAGAIENAFPEFITDFSAKEFVLLMNFRTSLPLVEIQHHIAKTLDQNYQKIQSQASCKIDSNIEEVASIWNFTNIQHECQFIANWIAQNLQERNLLAEDYAILVRQKPDDFYLNLVDEFTSRDLHLRNESARFGKLSLIDITSDGLFNFIVNTMRLVIVQPSPDAWTIVSRYMSLFINDDELKTSKKGDIDYLINKILTPCLGDYRNCIEILKQLLFKIIDFTGKDRIKKVFPYYAEEENLKIFLESTQEYLSFCAKKEASWQGFIDFAEGKNQVRLLTIHKSKGLEFDTVIFMGFDDKSWWSYSPQNPEGKATFFVAFSRAKQRVIFSYSDGGKRKISELYQLLISAGVPEKNFEKIK